MIYSENLDIPSFNKNLNLRKYKLKKNFLIIGSAHSLKEIRVKEKQNVDLIKRSFSGRNWKFHKFEKIKH